MFFEVIPGLFKRVSGFTSTSRLELLRTSEERDLRARPPVGMADSKKCLSSADIATLRISLSIFSRSAFLKGFSVESLEALMRRTLFRSRTVLTCLYLGLDELTDNSVQVRSLPTSFFCKKFHK